MPLFVAFHGPHDTGCAAGGRAGSAGRARAARLEALRARHAQGVARRTFGSRLTYS
jgi:hypothetical protein